MFRLTNCVFLILNMLMLIFSIVTILSSVYITLNGVSTECQKVLETPLLVLGVFLFVLSLLGLIGSFYRLVIVLWIYSFVTFVLVLMILVFMVLSFSVTNKFLSKTLTELGYKDYSSWLENRFENGKNWDRTKSCLIDAKICGSLGNDHNLHKAAEFYKAKLSAIQSGCCKPPTRCGFEFKNETFWVKPASSGAAVKDRDCTKWSNVQDRLCYDCNSCKAGVLENIRNDRRVLEIVNACVLVYIIIIYSTSCCTRRNLKPRYRNASFYNYKGYYA